MLLCSEVLKDENSVIKFYKKLVEEAENRFKIE
jgi:hypothetical protein